MPTTIAETAKISPSFGLSGTLIALDRRTTNSQASIMSVRCSSGSSAKPRMARTL